MKALCIRMNGSSWFFDYEEGNEEELLASILSTAQQAETPFSVDDVVDIVQQFPNIFAAAA